MYNRYRYLWYYRRERIKEYLRYAHYLHAPDIALIGAYNTTNIGDITMGMALKKRLERELGVSVKIFGLKHANPPSKSMVVWGGGDIIFDDYKNRLERLTAPVRKGMPTCYVGIGGGLLFREESMRYLDFMRKARLITVRDKPSQVRLQQLLSRPIPLTSDLAFITRYPKRINIEERDNIIGLQVRPLYQYLETKEFKYSLKEPSEWYRKIYPGREISGMAGREGIVRRYEAFMKNIVRQAHGKGFKIAVVPFCADDYLYAVQMFSGLPVKVYPLDMSPYRVLKIISGMKGFVCTCFHSLVYCIMSLTPMAVVEYAEKVSNLAGQLKGVERFPLEKIPMDYMPKFDVDQQELDVLRRKNRSMAMKNVHLVNNIYYGIR